MFITSDMRNRFTHIKYNLWFKNVHIFELAIGVLKLCTFVSATSYGAPMASCRSMFPHHGASSMIGECPYVIEASPSTIDSSGSISVTIKRWNGTGTPKFKGFMLQAKPSLLSQKMGQMPIGAFKFVEGTRRMNCFKLDSSAVTHERAQYFHEAYAEWIPPKGFTGRVTFIGTVVVKFKEIWVGLESNPVKVFRNESYS